LNPIIPMPVKMKKVK